MTPSFETIARKILFNAFAEDSPLYERTIRHIAQALREAHAAGLDEGAEVAQEKLSNIMAGNYSVVVHSYKSQICGALRARASEVREGK